MNEDEDPGPIKLSEYDELEHQEGGEEWLMSYADLMTLTGSFFIMMMAFANFEEPVFVEMANELGRHFRGATAQEKPGKSSDMEKLGLMFETHIVSEEYVEVMSSPVGVDLIFEGTVFFNPGSSEIQDWGISRLKKMVEIMRGELMLNVNIEVEGHADDRPIVSDKFPSNWELSAARAASVVRYLEQNSFAPEKLKASGYGASRPRVPNRDGEGNPIIENMKKNRRVLIRIRKDDYQKFKMGLGNYREMMLKIKQKREGKKQAKKDVLVR